jgi:hypothetical protein
MHLSSFATVAKLNEGNPIRGRMALRHLLRSRAAAERAASLDIAPLAALVLPCCDIELFFPSTQLAVRDFLVAKDMEQQYWGCDVG